MFSDTCPETGTGKCQGCFRFRYLRKFLDVFWNLRICLCRLRKARHSQDKNLMPMTQKKLAGIGVTCNGVMSHPKERGGDVTCITELHTHHSCFKYD